MEFTGERFMLQVDDPSINYEHWHRYQFAGQFTKDRRVLDIACGEGYGSKFLSNNAGAVVGVDISPETVDHASNKYGGGNLAFMVGSVGKIPIGENHSFDVIVSFETIEHVDDADQRAFLAEVKRLLSLAGVFIVSTPNKLVYTDLMACKNEFHVKEFYYSEFKEFLSGHFRNVVMLDQRIETGSYIRCMADEKAAFHEYRIDHSDKGFHPTSETRKPLYFLAVCSDETIESIPSSLCMDLSRRIIEIREERIRELTNVIHGLSAQLADIQEGKAWKTALTLRRVANFALLPYRKLTGR